MGLILKLKTKKDMKGNNLQTVPTITINGGSKDYKIHLAAIAEFLEENEKNNIPDLMEMELLLTIITDMVIDCAKGSMLASEMKAPLQFLRQIGFLVKTGFTPIN
jgi:hypothetical protein